MNNYCVCELPCRVGSSPTRIWEGGERAGSSKLIHRAFDGVKMGTATLYSCLTISWSNGCLGPLAGFRSLPNIIPTPPG